MKVLFLDIDGVVNCNETRQRHGVFIGIDPKLAAIVQGIIKDTGCKVVLSSTWRLAPDNLKAVTEQVCELYDTTQDLPNSIRGLEVNEWLSRHPAVTKYAILDDNSDFLPEQPLFQTTWQKGITEDIAKQVIEHLNT